MKNKMNRLNILLDLDETLISAITIKEYLKLRKNPSFIAKEFRFESSNMEDEYQIFARPGLQKFLTFLFENFNVSVWTAASKSYALFIIEEYIFKNHPERKLDYVFFSMHCSQSIKNFSSQKNLNMLETIGYHRDDTWIIDDHPEVYRAQPMKCLRVLPFHIDDKDSENDQELTRITNSLVKIRNSRRFKI